MDINLSLIIALIIILLMAGGILTAAIREHSVLE
jgi:hypothetical protein